MPVEQQELCDRYAHLAGARSAVLVPAGDIRSAIELLDIGKVESQPVRFAESIASENLAVVDIRALASGSRGAGAWLAVDNSFATWFGCQPLAQGAVLCFERCGDAELGYVSVARSGSRKRRQDPIAEAAYEVFGQGVVAFAPPSASQIQIASHYLDDVAAHAQARFDNARALAEYLAANEHAPQVIYPGLSSHPSHAIAANTLQHGFGAQVDLVLPPEVNAGDFIATCAPVHVTIRDGGEPQRVRITLPHDGLLPLIDRIDPLLRTAPRCRCA